MSTVEKCSIYFLCCSTLLTVIFFSIPPQVLKKDLYFDPEFWNLIALRTNCLKLMSEKVVSAALEEIMEDKWILNYCTKEPGSRLSTLACQKENKRALQAAAKKRHHKEDRRHKEDTDTSPKRLKVGPGRTRLNVDNTAKRKGNQGSRPLKVTSSVPLRRSFWQLDRLQDNGGYGELRRTTRLSEKNPPKRRIRKPKWLLDSGTLEENNVPPKIKKHGLKHQKHHQPSVEKRSDTGQIKNNAKQKPSVNSTTVARENNNSKHQKGFSLDCLQPTAPPQVILELSLPDNELMGTFIEDTCNRQRGFPQVLLYKPTVKFPTTSQPAKTVHRKEVILRARDPAMFIQQLHCYVRRQKGKGNGSNVQGSVSTITRSSVQGSPPKGPQRKLSEKPASDRKGVNASQTTAASKVSESQVTEKVLQVETTKRVLQKTSSARELSEKSAVEMKVTVASKTPAAKATESPVLDTVCQAQSTGKVLQTKTRELPEKHAAETELTNTLQTAAAETEVTEAPVLERVLQAQTGELCEESAVEMKVTIASQTPTAGKVTQSSGVDRVSNPETVKDPSKTTTSAEVLQTLTLGNSQMEVTGKIPSVSSIANTNIGDDDTMPTQTSDVVVRDGKRLELKSLEVLRTVSSISEVDVSSKLSQGELPFENDTFPGGTVLTNYTSTDQNSINDISALTLVTEMVTELSPETLIQKRTALDDSIPKESRAGNKVHTTSSCTVPELRASAVADVHEETVETQDIEAETPENSEPVESEESKLEYCCTFCNKVFKGSRVVAHAMFHYRKDECMFCGIVFKDDLLAMMHLSDHIEKLKKSKESAGNSAQENWVSETKDISIPKTPAKAKATNMSSGPRSSGRPKQSAVSDKSVSLRDSTPPGSRKLRSSDKPVEQKEKKQNLSEHLNSETPIRRVNGHIGKKIKFDRPKKSTLNSEVKHPHTQQENAKENTSDGTENPRLQKKLDTQMDSATSAQMDKKLSRSTDHASKETKSLQDTEIAKKNVEIQNKVCCPVNSCAWFTDPSKNRVALLYHALEDHYGEVKPLELAFRIGNSRCSICMRVLWSFEHFQHHVERHKLTPRHPCLHQGCTARFKTGMEMRRHARRHSPLQAVCCLPGCSQLFICLWALNLHEREHYASKPTKPDKNTNDRIGDKHNKTPAGKKRLDQKPEDETATTAVNKTVSLKATRKSRGQAQDSSTGKNVKAPSPNTLRASLLKPELKGSNDSQDSHVLKNLSNKDTSAQPAGPNLRLRQTLRNVNAASTALGAFKSHKVISSSLLRHNFKVRHKFKKKQVKISTKGPKRRGRPPKSKKAVYDENTAQLASCSEAAEPSDSSKELTKEKKNQQVSDVAKTAETLTDESKSKKSINKQVKKNQAEQKGVSNNSSTSVVTASSSNQPISSTLADKTQESAAVKMKLHKAKKCSTSKKIGLHTASCKSKKHKVTNVKAKTEIKKRIPLKEPGESLPASKKLAKSDSVVPQAEAKASPATAENLADEEGKSDGKNTDSTQNCSGNSVPAAPANCLNEITSSPTTPGEKTQKETAKQKLKKSDIKKKEGKKEEKTHIASSNAGKTSKKHKYTDIKGDQKAFKGKHPCKDAVKRSALKKTAKSESVNKQVEAKAAAESSPDVEGKAEETSETILDSSCSSTPAATSSDSNETTPPSTAAEKIMKKVKKKENSKNSHPTKNSDPNKANKKRKVAREEGDTKTVKKKCKDQSVSSESRKSATTKPEVQPLTEVKAPLTEVKAEVAESSVVEDGKSSGEAPQATINGPGYSVVMNGQAAAEDVKPAVRKDTLEKYSKRPFMRPPPTAYLDEKYITMPKKRKELSFFPSFQITPISEQIKVTTALQRQRCANCFATFNSAEDLQSHLQLQKCSNLFGFDSDDEGESMFIIIEI